MSSLHKDAPKASLEEYLKDYEVLKEEIVEGVKIVVVLPKNKLKQIENIKKANRKYYENHKTDVNKQIADWRKEKYKNDPEFKQRALEASRRCKAKKKDKEEDKKEE